MKDTFTIHTIRTIDHCAGYPTPTFLASLASHSRCVEPFEVFLGAAFSELSIKLAGAHADWTIVLNSHVAPATWIEQCSKKLVIVYNTEVESTWSGAYRGLMNRAHAVWHYSSAYTFGNNPSYVPLWLPAAGQKPRLHGPERSVSMGFYGSLNHRRMRVLADAGITNVATFGTYGRALEDYVQNCSAIISPQYYEGAPVCHARIMQALSFGCQVLSEDGPDSEDFPGVYFASYDRLAECAKLITSGNARLRADSIASRVPSTPMAGTAHLKESRFELLKQALKSL